ncbi:hypothetical protein UFB30_13655 [Jeotgalibacillus sp. HH7-29]|uniref:Uncharacterized protein n=1 Tax=Jeotgalibacillus haloalkalitolerans TaxID=3104292 RepID=A0ABU5KPU3_9BACL|nr:hypothetical protein [Jeotgalibacillus sp. HH7-29]
MLFKTGSVNITTAAFHCGEMWSLQTDANAGHGQENDVVCPAGGAGVFTSPFLVYLSPIGFITSPFN